MSDATDQAYMALLIAASQAGQRGQFAAAIAGFGRAIAAQPARYEAYAGLAQCEVAARQPDAALANFDAAIARAPGSAALLCAKAAVHRSLAQPDAASALYDKALRLDPGCTAAALGRIGLYVDAGQSAEAAAVLATITGPDRTRLDVRWTAARLALAAGDLAAAHNDAAALVATPGLNDAQRSEALLLLGEILDGLDDPAAAFAAAAEGKALARRLYAELAASRESEAAKSARLGAWWGAAPAAAWTGAPRAAAIPGEAAAHVFLIGFPRSGTTLLEQILAGHPDVVALEEAPTLADHYAEFLADDAGCSRLAALSGVEADRWRARYWATVAEAVDVRGKSFVDKAPAGTLTLPLIARLFPEARILFALRDPRDVVLSCFRNAFQMNAMTYAFTSLDATAECYDAVMSMAAAYRSRSSLPLFEVRHEALVDDLAAEVARVAAFIGLAAHAAMVDFVATAARREVRTPSARQVRAGINRRGVGRWRTYAADLAPVLPRLDRWVETFGY
ncbi:sulfotransferase family protein [Glacieibacterium megasporae]|uniref:sulfotransferase family protein n=1 Tax=Glacieibacterium megasporae TaxID=2835787 RepID=UPI001C1E6407|nr:sulfotransferase [Polymorphobacter megasporae]UAJ09038.1 sulfotransferase [Polymorphobacter megasporae]